VGATQRARAGHRSRELVRQQAGDLARERDRAGGGGSDRAERVFDGVFLQDVARCARREDLGDPDRIADHRVRDEAGGRRGSEEPLHELGASEPFERQLRHDHVRPRANGRFHAAEGVGRDLDLEIVLPKEVVLEPGDLVGRVAEQHGGGHLLGVSAPGEGG
jgi:hypothetical protein